MIDIPELWNGTMDATEEIQKICDEVNGQVKERTNETYEEFTAVKYRDWVNIHFGTACYWFIKVHVGGVNYIHLCVSQAYEESGLELVGVQKQKTKEDPLVLFVQEV